MNQESKKSLWGHYLLSITFSVMIALAIFVVAAGVGVMILASSIQNQLPPQDPERFEAAMKVVAVCVGAVIVVVAIWEWFESLFSPRHDALANAIAEISYRGQGPNRRCELANESFAKFGEQDRCTRACSFSGHAALSEV